MDEFLTAAIVGTAQYKNALPSTHSAVDTLTNQLPTEQKERAFLLAAGAHAVYLQAGHQATTKLEPPIPAEPETLQPCSERIGSLIIDLFTEQHVPLLPEALQRLRAAQKRVPYTILPECLSYGTYHKKTRADLTPVLGERARWLSQFNTSWKWINDELLTLNNALPADAETIWQEGTLEQRQQILQRLRAQDPEKARDWLQAVWQQEKAETRATFLLCLQEGISSNDQVFIEQALEDRSEGVREVAVSLLHFIPAAPQMQTMLKAVSDMLDYKKDATKKRFSLKLPKPIDPAWENTISIIKVKHDDKHDAQYWLWQAFSRISPQYWEEHFASSPEELVSALSKLSSGHALLYRLMQAALLHHTTNWYAPLIEWYVSYMLRPHPIQMVNEEFGEMLAALSQSQQEALLAPLQEKPEHLEKAIDWLPAPWSETFSRNFIRVAKDYDPTETSVGFSFWSSSLPVIARALHPSCFKLAQELWDKSPDDTKITWQIQRIQEYIRAFMALIQLRARILEEIK